MPKPLKMPLADRFAAYNRLRRRQGKAPVTMAEYEAKHYGKNGVFARKASDGNGCKFPLWRDKVTHEYCGRVRQADAPYCREHQRLTRQEGTSYNEFERTRKRGDRRKAMVFGRAA